MRTRKHAILFRLNDEEYARFRKNVERTGISQEAYLRQLVANRVPKEAPPANYYQFMKSLYYVGNSLNQIARIANSYHQVDSKKLNATLEQYNKLVTDITNAVIRPDDGS